VKIKIVVEFNEDAIFDC